MNNDLYFIPIIVRALDAPDSERALREAFGTIEKLGQTQGYEKGYVQFQMFMKRVADEAITLSLLQKDVWAEPPGAGEDPYPVGVSLAKKGGIPRDILFKTVSGMASFDNTSPGDYTLRLSTGRVLWEGKLQEEDVCWAKAYPGVPLALAADTEDAVSAKPSREIVLLGGEVVVRVFPGMECGRLEIELRKPGRED